MVRKLFWLRDIGPMDEAARRKRNRANWFVAAAVIVGLLYVLGTFDRALYPVGLNYKACGQNGFGAVFCGDDLEQYKARIGK